MLLSWLIIFFYFHESHEFYYYSRQMVPQVTKFMLCLELYWQRIERNLRYIHNRDTWAGRSASKAR